MPELTAHPSLYSIWPLCPTLPIRQLSVLKMFPSPSHFFSSKLLIIFLDGLFWFMSAFPPAYLLPSSIFKYMLLASWWDDDNKIIATSVNYPYVQLYWALQCHCLQWPSTMDESRNDPRQLDFLVQMPLSLSSDAFLSSSFCHVAWSILMGS